MGRCLSVHPELLCEIFGSNFVWGVYTKGYQANICLVIVGPLTAGFSRTQVRVVS
jgi:hypothetical protein